MRPDYSDLRVASEGLLKAEKRLLELAQPLSSLRCFGGRMGKYVKRSLRERLFALNHWQWPSKWVFTPDPSSILPKNGETVTFKRHGVFKAPAMT